MADEMTDEEREQARQQQWALWGEVNEKAVEIFEMAHSDDPEVMARYREHLLFVAADNLLAVNLLDARALVAAVGATGDEQTNG